MRYLSLFSGIGGFELGIQSAYVAINEGSAVGEKQAHPSRASGARGRLVSAPREAAGNSARTGRGDDHGRAQLRHPTCVGYSEIDPYAVAVYRQHYPSHTNYGDITKIDAKGLPDFDLVVGGFPCQSFSIAGARGGFGDTRGTLFFDVARIVEAKRPRLLLLENVKGLLNHDEGRTFATIIRTLDELGYDLQWQLLNGKSWLPQNRERVFIVGSARETRRPQVFPFIGEDEADEGEVTSTAIDANYFKGVDNHGQRTMIAQTGGIRRLTPLECERLQGFPDGWTASQSDTQRYKMLGNAVMVPNIAAIIERLIPTLR
jgi:site-specific DNA-cytosine methylase